MEKLNSEKQHYKDLLNRAEKFSGEKRKRDEVDEEKSQEDSEKSIESKEQESHKRAKTEETKEVSGGGLKEKLKRLSEKKNHKQVGSSEKRRPFSFVSVLQKAKSNLVSEK